MAEKRRRRRSRRADEWREIVEAWRASGESAVAYAKRHDLSEYGLWKWSKRLRDASQDATRRKSVPPKFVPVSVGDSNQQTTEQSDRLLLRGSVEIESMRGHTIRLKGSVPLEAVAAIVSKLDSSC